MKNAFQLILNDYLKDTNIKVDSTKDYYKTITKIIPDKLYEFIDKDKYLIKGSCGQGNKTDTPWICVFNKNITTTATYGLYVCYLFKTDMSGFYLTIGQGITTFKNRYGSKKYEYANKITEYFRSLIVDTSFSKDKIDLKSRVNSLGYGYENTNIISKYYAFDDYEEETLIKDFINMMKIYDFLYETMAPWNYDDIIENVILNHEEDLIDINKADEIIKKILVEHTVKESIKISKIKEIAIPQVNKIKSQNVSKKKINKVDYLKKAKKDIEIGLNGERLVLEYEKEKMMKKSRKDLVDKIKWVSKNDDTLGYDIVSYEFDHQDKEYKIYIEVKATESNEKNEFFISKNELKVMKKLKEKYWIYRVCNSNKEKVFYKINGLDFQKTFSLTPQHYIAEFK